MDLDCVGIGAGPANLSLACLLHSHAEITGLFIDRMKQFSWHDGQQVSGAELQVSPLKDLVTLSDPKNPFSFLSYLHEQGRLFHFLNAQFSAVPRREFRNYLQWAGETNPRVVLGEEVHGVDFAGGRFVVETSERQVYARNVVVGVGQEAWVPPIARANLGQTQFHVSEFVSRACALGGRRVAVVGGGQSGAETVLDVLSRPERELPERVHWISRRSNFLPIDDSPFTNDLFTPSYSAYFNNLDGKSRKELNRDSTLASDGISLSTLRDIYQTTYTHHFVAGREALLQLYPNRTVTAVDWTAGSWRVCWTNNVLPDRGDCVPVDIVIWATGFRPADSSFLDPVAGRFERDGNEFRVDDAFAVHWDGPADRRVFLQNATREQWGVSDPNLSLLAWRSQQIVDRLRGVRSTAQIPSFIAWQDRERSEASLGCGG